jgi:hypothetical protein
MCPFLWLCEVGAMEFVRTGRFVQNQYCTVRGPLKVRSSYLQSPSVRGTRETEQELARRAADVCIIHKKSTSATLPSTTNRKESKNWKEEYKEVIFRFIFISFLVYYLLVYY